MMDLTKDLGKKMTIKVNESLHSSEDVKIDQQVSVCSNGLFLKTCPHCAEKDLQPEAKVCKHCGKSLSEKATVDYEIALLGIPICSAFLTWFWVGGMPLISFPENTLAMLTVGTVLATALCAAIEMNGAKHTASFKKDGDSPIAVFVLFLMCWVVAYPYYLFHRRCYGLPSRLLVGLIVMAICLGSMFVMYHSIETQKVNIRATLEGIGQSFQ